MQTISRKSNVCCGPSMYPTMRSADVLVLDKYKDIGEIKKGDIILYKHPERPFEVVHRIVRKGAEGVETRGDNNSHVDPYVVKYEDIKGRIIMVRRGVKSISLASGMRGFMVHKMMLARRVFVKKILKPLRLVSNAVAESGLLYFVHRFLKIKIVTVAKNGREMYVLSHMNKAVGRRHNVPGGMWIIRFPYKLFIDRRRLP